MDFISMTKSWWKANFPNSAVPAQINAPQPRLAWLVVIYLFLSYGLTLITGLLMHLPAFAVFCTNHRALYIFSFYSIQAILVLSLALYFFRKYRMALHCPLVLKSLRVLCILLSLLIYHWKGIWAIGDYFQRLASTHDPDYIRQSIAALYPLVWHRLVSDISLPSVVCFSLKTMCYPICEEIFFSGFLANFLARKFGIPAAVIITPLCFAISHAPLYGLTDYVPLAAAGLLYVIIRLHTGSVLPSIASHILVNFVIMFPKWLVAICYFRIISPR